LVSGVSLLWDASEEKHLNNTIRLSLVVPNRDIYLEVEPFFTKDALKSNRKTSICILKTTLIAESFFF